MNKRQRKKLVKRIVGYYGPKVFNLARMRFDTEYVFVKRVDQYGGWIYTKKKLDEPLPF